MLININYSCSHHIWTHWAQGGWSDITIMELLAVDLGHVLLRVPNSQFSMENFDDRLRLQKLIYIVQAYGVYLGYDFSWYIRGPYCSILSGAGYALSKYYDKLQNIDKKNIQFEYPDLEAKFKKACKFIIRNSDNDSLEIAASIHLLKNSTNMTKDEILDKVEKKMPQFKMLHCKSMWQELEKDNVI